jgi:nucleoside-diphosphate-sugar epimerase
MEERFLVTGGAGFIGSHLVDALLARGDRVIAVDDLSTGRLENLRSARPNPRFRFVRGSMLDEDLVGKLVEDCDTVVHLAAAVGVQLVLAQPRRSLTTNLRGSEVVFEAASRLGTKTLLTSSSEVYGQSGALPLREDEQGLLGPSWRLRWGYAISKAANESLAFAHQRESHLPVIVARPFNAVGPRQSPSYGMVIPRLVRQAIANQPLTVYGDGTQTRCFCHVHDVVEALQGLLDDDRCVGQAFNIGSEEEVTILQLATRIIEMAESRSTIRLVPYEVAYPPGFEDLLRRVPDISKVRSQIGWSPKRSLDDILRDAIQETTMSGPPTHPS